MGEMDEKFNKPVSVEKLNDARNEKPEGLENNPELLAEKNIQEMGKRAEGLGLEKTKKLLADGTDSAELDPQTQEEVLEKKGITERLRMISEKAGDLLKKHKSKINKSVAIGMATVAFSGAGDFREASAEEAGSYADIESSEDLQERLKTDDVFKEKYEIAKKEIEKFENEEADKSRRELKEHISSQEYLNKLIVEFGGDVERARKMQKQRINNLETLDFSFEDSDKFGVGLYDPVEHRATADRRINDILLGNISDPEIEISEAVKHEMFHGSTRGHVNIPEKSRKTLKNSFVGRDENEWGGFNAYFGNETERLARKQILDLEMEKLGIKKYGEKFTEEHYNKLMEFYEKNKLSSDANQFIETTKPEDFEKIFNEIAENDHHDKRNSVEQV